MWQSRLAVWTEIPYMSDQWLKNLKRACLPRVEKKSSLNKFATSMSKTNFKCCYRAKILGQCCCRLQLYVNEFLSLAYHLRITYFCRVRRRGYDTPRMYYRARKNIPIRMKRGECFEPKTLVSWPSVSRSRRRPILPSLYRKRVAF